MLERERDLAFQEMPFHLGSRMLEDIITRLRSFTRWQAVAGGKFLPASYLAFIYHLAHTFPHAQTSRLFHVDCRPRQLHFRPRP